MAIAVDKKWLNCKADFKSITLSNLVIFLEDFKNTIPALFIHNEFKDVCYYKLGNITEIVSCDRRNEPPSKSLIEEATARYILEHRNFFSEDCAGAHDRTFFAQIKLQEEMCAYTPDPGPASGITVVTTVVGVGALCILGYTLFNCITHGVAHE